MQIRIKPYEFLQMKIPDVSSSNGKGSLYITPQRIILCTKNGPVYEKNIQDIEQITGTGYKGTIITNEDELSISTKNFTSSTWGKTIEFWKKGVLQNIKMKNIPKVDEIENAVELQIKQHMIDSFDLPTYSDIRELPEILQNSDFSFRPYNITELEKEDGPEGKIKKSKELDKIVQDTNIVLAALRYDGFILGPPPAYYIRMLQRHCLNFIDTLLYNWIQGKEYITDVIRGKGYLARASARFLEFASWPDRFYVSKPYMPNKQEWYHEINPASLGGFPYNILQKCSTMIPIIQKTANEIHKEPTNNPHMRLREVYLSIRDGKPIPIPKQSTMEVARQYTEYPW